MKQDLIVLWVHKDGDKWWLVNDRLHRIEGPAVIEADYEKTWYHDGRIVRGR